MQKSGTDLESLVTWFRNFSDIDPKATLAFPATLSQSQRAKIHGLVKSIGLGALESVSAGIGDNRFISIVRSGIARTNGMTSVQQHKSFWIYRWAKNAHMRVSRDEVAEMLLKDALPKDLEALWVEGSAQQKLIIKLCQAIVEDDAAAFKVCPWTQGLPSLPLSYCTDIQGPYSMFKPSCTFSCIPYAKSTL